MGGHGPSPSKKIHQLLDLDDAQLDFVSDIVFSEKHYAPDSLMASLENFTGRRLSESQKLEIGDFWESQYTGGYEIEGACEFLRNLVQSGLDIHIVSNIWLPFYNRYKEIFKDIKGFVKSETLSCMVGARKPSTDIYKIAIERSGALPEKSVMVGDSLANDIMPCADLGMKCVWFLSRSLEQSVLESKRALYSTYDHVFEASSLLEVESIIKRIVENDGKKN